MNELLLDKVILKRSCKMLNYLLKINSSLINNHCTKKNTLNCAIKSVFNDKSNGFSFKFIKSLIKNGALVSNDCSEFNSLHISLIQGQRYIDSFYNNDRKIIAEKNVIKIINLLINNGAVSIYQGDINTFSIGMKTNNANIVNSILFLKPLPCNGKNNSNTLNLALCSKNIDLLKIALENWAQPNDQTCNIIITSMDPKLIEEFIISGGKSYNINLGSHLFDHFFSNCAKYSDSDFDHVIELLMCMCIKMSYYLIDKIFKFILKINYHMHANFIACFHILQNSMENDSVIINLRNRLNKRMNELVDLASYGGYDNRKNLIESTLICIPIPCTDIINEYQHSPLKFDVIDWSLESKSYFSI